MTAAPPSGSDAADPALQHPAVLGLKQFSFYSAILCNPAGRIVWVNAAFESMMGYAEAEVLGRMPGEVLQGPGTDRRMADAMQAAIEAGQPFRGDVQNYHKSGRGIWVRIEITPVRDSAGEIVAFFSVGADVSDLKEAEASLRMRDALFRSAFNMSRVVGWRAVAATGRVDFITETEGLSLEGGRTLNFDNAVGLYTPEYREDVLAAYTRAFETGEPVSHVAQLMVDDERLWVQVTAEPEFEDGRVVALNGVLQDISGITAAQRMLAEKDRYTDRLMDVMEARVGIINSDGEIIHANRVWRERLAALGAAWGVPFTWNYREQCARIEDAYGRELEAGITAILEGRSKRFSTVFCSRLSDPPQWFKFDAAALEGAGEAKMVVMQHNITELKEAEAKLEAANAVLESARREAEAANHAKSQFLANLSHEIRTPLNGVVAIADMLSRAPLEPEALDMVETIRTSAGTLSRLLADMLDLARIESGRVEMEPVPFRLADAVRAVTALSDLVAREKGLDLQVDCDGDPWVLGDVNRFKQVLTNLVSNAVKFTPRGEVRVTVRLSDAGICRVDVSDTGVGFTSGDRHRLFDRFEQADSSVIREYGGSGLGLAIVRELVDLMGGQLDCVSEPGVGSVFTVVLPLPQTAASAPAAGDHSAPGRPAATRHLGGEALSVLLAEDHPINRRVVELILKGFNVDLTSVEDGAAAVDAVRRRPGGFDLVLMDMQMPVMDGLTATRALRRLEAAEGWPRLPVIMVSANAMPSHLTESLAAGADLHLAKPLTAQSLVDSLETVLETYQGAAAMGLEP